MVIDEAEVAAAWDRNAAVWTRQVRNGADLYRELFNNPAFLDFLPDLSGKEVIDFGCGEGANTRLLAKRGLRMTGVDISGEMIALAREAETHEPLGIPYLRGSFTDLSCLVDERFDAAVSTMALMDSPDFLAAAREAFWLTRPGGIFAFSVLHPCFITPEMRWLRTDGDRYASLAVGRYFDDRSFVERWRFSKAPQAMDDPPFEVPRFPRTLTTYVNGVIEAGFRLLKIEEPRPSQAMAEAHPWLARWREHAAIFLYVAAYKPPHDRGEGNEGN